MKPSFLYNIPSLKKIRERTKTIYKKAFHKTNNKIIYIPYPTKPIDLIKHLADKGLV